MEVRPEFCSAVSQLDGKNFAWERTDYSSTIEKQSEFVLGLSLIDSLSSLKCTRKQFEERKKSEKHRFGLN